MTTHIDVVAELDNRSVMVSANDLKGGLERIGDDAGRGFGTAFGRGTSTASAGLDGMRGRIVAVTNQAISLGGHLADVDRTAVGLGQKGVTAFSGMGTSALAASVGIAAVGTAAVVVGKQLYDLGAEWDNIADGITIRTGKVGDQLNALTDVVGDVGSATAASLGSIGEIVGQLSQSMPGLTENGTAIRQMASNLAYLDANGQAVNIRELGKAFTAFGVGAGDQVKTLDELNSVSQATGLPINQLIGSVQSGAAQFKQFGLDIGGATSLIASFEDAGLDSGVAVTGLRTALKNVGDDARGAGPALADAVTQIKKLHDAGREAGALKLAQDTFGVKNFAPFLDAIENGRIGVEGLDKAFGDLGMTIAEQQKATDDGAQGWQKLVNTIKTEAGPAANGFFSFLNNEVQYLTGNLTDAADKLKDVAAVPIDPKSALGQILTSGGVAIPGTGGPGVGVTRPTGIGTGTTPAPGGLLLPNGLLAPNWGSNQVAAPSSAAGGAAKTPGAPGVPFDTTLPPGFAQLPQTAELYSAESSFLDARHGTAEKQAKLNQLLHDNTATEDQIINARVDVAQAQRSQTEAEMRLYDTQNKQLKNQTGQLNQIGAQLDSDFGISKGLAGIAENITKFVANLAVAPWEKQMNDIANAPGQAKGGYGLLGILGAQGAFGPQFTAAGQAADANSGASALGPSGLMPGGAYPGDAALLANVPRGIGQYDNVTKDLSRGLVDCASGVEDLVNLMDGKSTVGGSLWTGNASTVLPQMGFQPGMGGPGDFRVGYNSHHMQATLPQGTNVNYGSTPAIQAGGLDGGMGAFDPALTSHYFRPAGGATGSPAVPSISIGAPAGGVAPSGFGGLPIPLPVTIVGGGGIGFTGGPPVAPGAPTPGAPASTNPYAPAPTAPGGTGFSSGDVTNPALTNPPAPGAAGPLPAIPAGAGGGQGFMGLGGPPMAGGPGVGPTQIGGGDGLTGSGKGGIGASDSTMALAGMAASALDVMAPGAGQAAQTAMKLANRAIQYGGQVAGIGVQGAMDTFLPFGGSKLASDSWASKLIGGIAGAAPALPNMAGKAAAAPANQQGGQGQGGTTYGDTNISVKEDPNRGADGTGRDMAYHAQEMQAMPGRP